MDLHVSTQTLWETVAGILIRAYKNMHYRSLSLFSLNDVESSEDFYLWSCI